MAKTESVHGFHQQGLVEINGRDYFVMVTLDGSVSLARDNGQPGTEACISGSGKVLVLAGRTSFWPASEWQQIADFVGHPEIMTALAGQIGQS